MKLNDTYQMKVKIPPEEVVYVDMVFKSHEGIAMLKLDQKHEGLIKLDYTPGTRETVLEVLEALNLEFDLEIVEDDYVGQDG